LILCKAIIYIRTMSSLSQFEFLAPNIYMLMRVAMTESVEEEYI
jgi:hypothetical protein